MKHRQDGEGPDRPAADPRRWSGPAMRYSTGLEHRRGFVARLCPAIAHRRPFFSASVVLLAATAWVLPGATLRTDAVRETALPAIRAQQETARCDIFEIACNSIDDACAHLDALDYDGALTQCEYEAAYVLCHGANRFCEELDYACTERGHRLYIDPGTEGGGFEADGPAEVYAPRWEGRPSASPHRPPHLDDNEVDLSEQPSPKTNW